MKPRTALRNALVMALACAAHGAHADDLLPRRPFAFTQELIARLPFGEGSDFTIANGYSGQRQSAPVDRRYVVGFKLKPGTAITAVADGTVSAVDAEGDSVRVVVTLFDGTQAYYIGVAKQGLTAVTGNSVRNGGLLGRSDALLYFALVTGSGDAVASQPLIFVNGEPPVDFIEARTGATGTVSYQPKAPPPPPEVAAAPEPPPTPPPEAPVVNPRPNPISLATHSNQRAHDEAERAEPPAAKPPPRTFMSGILSLWPLALLVAAAAGFNAYRNGPRAPKRETVRRTPAFWRRKATATANENSVR